MQKKAVDIDEIETLLKNKKPLLLSTVFVF